MHIRYEQFEATQMVEDHDVKAMLDRTKDREATCFFLPKKILYFLNKKLVVFL